MDKCIVVGNRCAALRGNRLKVCLVVFIPLFFDKLIKVSEVVPQLGLQSLERIYQLSITTVMDMCTLLRFT